MDKTVTATLKAGQTYYFDVGFAEVNDYGAVEVVVKLQSQNGFGNISVALPSDYQSTLIEFIPEKTSPVDINSVNTNVSFAFLDANFNILETRDQNKIAMKVSENYKYYVLIKNKTLTAFTESISFAEPQLFTEGEQVSREIATENMFVRFKGVGNFVFSIKGVGNSIITTEFVGINGSVNEMLTSGSKNLSFTLENEQEIYFGLKANQATPVTLQFAKTENAYKWVVGGS